MFLDLGMNGPNGYWDEGPVCKSCKQLISAAEPSEELRFTTLDDARFDGMDGLYHSICAKPFLSLIRAMDMLNRFAR